MIACSNDVESNNNKNGVGAPVGTQTDDPSQSEKQQENSGHTHLGLDEDGVMNEDEEGSTRISGNSSPIKLGHQSTGSQASGSLKQHLTSFFNPSARQKREHKNGMTHFYTMQLQDANKTIELLWSEINHLCNEINQS
ncbi:uncharacterized protein VP01_4381g2 [Puccinia sorghi]|uniref:Uncharacterized protein n=1 Tax=Puccinia sorghi TaxID=27349 RepID=A0A0L6UQJ7_9BASI|nr:uncharacterized protein VP01_4381g2 [Puccinia sorghi]